MSPSDAALLADTPCVVVDRAKLEANLRRVQAIADAHGLRLRPHIKTHKCPALWELQRRLGAVGVTAAKPREAAVFMRAGVPSVTLAYPLVVKSKAEALLAVAAEHGTDLRCVADSEAGVEALEASARARGERLPVYLKIDVGFGRCGVPEDAPRLLPLARRVHTSPTLRFVGLLSHAGQVYAAKSRDEARAVAETEQRVMVRVRERLEAAGVSELEVSVGSTPTVLAATSFDGITEIRPGNYVFLDLNQHGIGTIGREAIALSVVATVVSRNDRWLIIDAGSKLLSSDSGAHGSPGAGFGLAYPLDADVRGPGKPIERLSEEHGFVARGDADIPIGTRLRVLPNHACAVANLAERFVVVDDAGHAETWDVAARGKVR